MNFKTHNDKEIDSTGTHLQGTINIDYKTLVKAFGEPNGSDGYKSDAEWDLLFDDGTPATIYNYKDGINYLDENGTPVEKITDWHIGGEDEKAVLHIEAVLKESRWNEKLDVILGETP